MSTRTNVLTYVREGVYHARDENCGSEFASEGGCLQHIRGGRCQTLEDMSESQLKARRATRAKAVLESGGEKIFDVEQVEVRSCNGGAAKARGSFLYLIIKVLLAQR